MAGIVVKIMLVLTLILHFEGSNADIGSTYRGLLERKAQFFGNLFSKPSSSSDRANSEDSVVSKFIKTITKPFTELMKTTGVDQVMNKVQPIVPGTLWCGGGSMAGSEQELGLFFKSDNCCREHDKCSTSIEAGKSMGPLINDGAFTRSHCLCDQQFYKCLKDAGTVISWKIGVKFFTVMRPQCFAVDYPVTTCIKYAPFRFVNPKCLKWNVNTNLEKTVQWFDNPDFYPYTDYHNHVY